RSSKSYRATLPHHSGKPSSRRTSATWMSPSPKPPTTLYSTPSAKATSSPARCSPKRSPRITNGSTSTSKTRCAKSSTRSTPTFAASPPKPPPISSPPRARTSSPAKSSSSSPKPT
ncbi:hypothetical protein LTR87_018106, partial [Friedmanniomyces endolithicus]